MKKRVILCIAFLSIAIGMCGCHSHEFSEATCTQPKTCIGCGETEGDVLPHSFSEATCTQPKTCTVCGATEGEALPHTFAEATCAAPKTCTVCAATEGEANNEHSTLLGKCEICGENQNFEVLSSVVNYLEKAYEYYKEAVDAMNNYNVSWAEYKLTYSQYEIVDAKKLLSQTDERIKETDLYKKMNNATCISFPSEDKYSDYSDYLLECVNRMEKYQQAFLEVLEEYDSIMNTFS